MKIMVSACLLGACCRYDGASKPDDTVKMLLRDHELIPVCPEQMGGLPTPRDPAERIGERVCTKTGRDVTQAYFHGAQEALQLYRLLGCEMACLKANSPSCGSDMIYDGTFTGIKIAGAGVTAQLFRENGIPVCSEKTLDKELIKG